MSLPKWFTYERIISVDVESFGLHGEPFAVGWVACDKNFDCVEEGILVRSRWIEDASFIEPDDAKWLRENIPPMRGDCETKQDLLKKFDERTKSLRAFPHVFIADCPVPVEARFFARMGWAPYPLLDVASMYAGRGFDPLETRLRGADEYPLHNPLCDARQTMRQFKELMDLFR